MAKKKYSHRPDAEWLTREICESYIRKAQALDSINAADIGPRRELRKELQYRCDISEVEALNIINGNHISIYVAVYERIRKILEEGLEPETEDDWEDWAEQEQEKNSDDGEGVD